jgi:beta-lactamase class A
MNNPVIGSGRRALALCKRMVSGLLLPATMPIEARVRKELAEFKGKVSLFAKNLDTGASFGINEDSRVRTASTIKIAIMVEAFARVAEGKASWADEVVLTNAKKVGGSGILQELSDGLRLRLRDAVTLMMIVSDNTATNLVLDVLTTDAVNARMDSLGLKQTRVLRKVFGGGVARIGEDPAFKPFGLGVTTPREMVTLLEKLERGEVVNRDASKEMLALMKREQIHDGIGRTLNGVEMATKLGARQCRTADAVTAVAHYDGRAGKASRRRTPLAGSRPACLLRLDRAAGVEPGVEAAFQRVRLVEPIIAEHLRHTGA